MMRPILRLTFALTICAVVLWAVRGADDPMEVIASGDTTITDQDQGQPGEWAGKQPTMRLMDHATEKHRILMAFEFKEQAARPCQGATLRLTTDKCWPGSKNSKIRVQRMVRPFTERWASWGYGLENDRWINPGGDFDANTVAARKFAKKDDGEGKVIDIDVTTLVQGWQNKQFANYGLLLAVDEDETNVHFHSREAADAAKRPRLLLYYASAPPKNAEMLPITSLKPLGKDVVMKTTITTTSLIKGAIGAAYKQQLIVNNGLPPYKWKITGLPDGITVSDDGLLSGTPTKAGTYNLVLTATGADKNAAMLKLPLIVDDPAAAKTAAAGEPGPLPGLTKDGAEKEKPKDVKKPGLADE